jgi:hypothetical protein
MGNSFSTCDCIDYDTFEDNIRIRRMENEIKNQRIAELSKKDFHSLSNDDEKVMEVEEYKMELEEESDDVKDISEYQSEIEEVQVLDDYQSETEEIKVLHIEIDDVGLKEPDNVEEIKIINPKSPAIKHIDEIINYLQQIPTNQELP